MFYAWKGSLKHSFLSWCNWEVMVQRGALTCLKSQNKAVVGLENTQGLLILSQGFVLCSSSCSLGPCSRLCGQLLAPPTRSLLSPSRAALVPIFSFGENDVFKQVENSPGSWVRWFQDRLQKIVRVSIPLFYGRGVFQYSFGLMPYRRPITTVGEPRLGVGEERATQSGAQAGVAKGTRHEPKTSLNFMEFMFQSVKQIHRQITLMKESLGWEM